MKKDWSNFMDRRLKERLVGATILIVLVVLIVPELLSGQKHSAGTPVATPASAEQGHTVTVDLATRKATAVDAAPASAVVGNEDTDLGAQALDGSQAAGQAGAVVGEEVAAPLLPARHPSIVTLQAQKPAVGAVDTAQPALTAKLVPSKINTTHEAGSATGLHHAWAVQLGVFASRVNAEKLQRELKAQRIHASVSASGAGASLRYRVRVGALSDRALAERLMARLQKEGHAARVVAP